MELKDKLSEVLNESRIKTDEPMSMHTTFRVGGKADYFLSPEIDEVADVVALLKEEKVPYYIIGNGSNLLVSDSGVRGAVIALEKQMSDISIDGNIIRAQAGCMLVRLAKSAMEESLSGLEFASGIPGTVGGALAMNAGAYGGEMKQVVKSIRIIDKDGEIKNIDAEKYDGSYRTSYIMKSGAIVLDAEFELGRGDKIAINQRMEELKEQRTQKQPLEYPSAGSTFKRPKDNFAGKLIMEAGLAGYTVGGAQVSEKHCGFVINKGGATASDIYKLMMDVTEKVKESSGIVLEPEVRLIGF